MAGEFPGLVAHAIREQLLLDRKRVLQEDFGDYHRPFQIAQLKVPAPTAAYHSIFGPF